MFARDHAAQFPDQPALIMATSGETITYAEYEARCNRVAHLFRDVGLARGDHVAIFMENNPRMLECEGARRAHRALLHGDQLVPLGRRGRLHRQRLRVAGGRHVGGQARGGHRSSRRCARTCERWLMVDIDTPDGEFEPYEAAVAGYTRRAGRRRAARRRDAVLVGHHRSAQGHPAAAARHARRPTPLPVMQFVQDAVPVPRGHDLPVAGAAVPLGAAGERVAGHCGSGATAVIMEHFDPDAVPRPRRAVPGHALPDGADDVLAAAEAARGGARRGRRLVARVHRPRRRAVPGAGEAGDDRVVGADHHRVLRRHRRPRLHVLRLRGVAGAPGHRRQADPR